jgi:hypothetical protein
MPDYRFPANPPEAILAWFRAKGIKPSFDYRDVWAEEHAHAFTVAKAMKADVLTTIRESVDKALAEGQTYQQFAKELTPTLQKLGWWGRADVVDPTTGEVINAQLGSPRRLKKIYATNMKVARAAGQWERIERRQKTHPYLVYELGPSEKHRVQHVAWAGIILRADDPFWQTHYPPNGWGCKCRVRQINQREYDKLVATGKYTTTAPRITKKEWINDRTGEVLQVPTGIDPGWDYNPGMHRAKSLNDNEKRSKEALKKAAAKPVPIPVEPTFKPQKTTKAAEQWAVENSIADFADYAGIKPEVANAWNESLFDHIKEFPKLRSNQKFIGTGQGQFKRYHALQVERMYHKLLERGMDPDRAKDYAPKLIKKPKVSAATYAHSWSQPDVKGVTVNKTWGKDPERFKRQLTSDVEKQFHPIGCDTIRSVVDHEIGHQLDDLLSLHTDKEVISLFSAARERGMKTEVSQYANKNIKEFIAEAWAESLNNSTPRTYARAIAGIIRDRYRSKFD